MTFIVSDVIRDNDPESLVIVCGINPDDDCDPFVKYYFEGALKDIPDGFKECEALQLGWSLGSDSHCISIPYQKS